MVAAKLAKMERGDNQHAQIFAPSQSDAADLLNVSRRAVQIPVLYEPKRFQISLDVPPACIAKRASKGVLVVLLCSICAIVAVFH